MTFFYVPGHVVLPGQAGDNLTIARSALGSIATYEVAMRVRLDGVGLQIFSGWRSNRSAFYLNGGNLLIQLYDGTSTCGAAPSTAGPAPGVDICIRGKLTRATALCEYWYSMQAAASYDNVTTWIPIGSAVGSNPGLAAPLTFSDVVMVGDSDLGFPFPGRCYWMVEIDDGVRSIEMNGEVDLADVSPAATSYAATTGQTVTVNRSGSPATVLVPTIFEEVAAPAPPVWSVDLCRDWVRIGQLQGDAYAFDGVEKELEPGGWTLAFPDGEPAWSSYNDPDLPNYLDHSGSLASVAATADKASLDITGDIDVRWFGSLDDWTSPNTVLNKWNDAGVNQRSWFLNVETGGVRVYISTTGTDFPFTAQFPVPFADGAYGGVRFTRVQTTGATTIYFSDDGVTWTSAGSTVLAAGTAIFASTAELRVGETTSFFPTSPTGRTQWAEVRNGIAGTVVASPDFTAQVPGTRTFVDDQNNVWVMASNAHIVQDPLVEQKMYVPDDVNTVRLVEDGHLRFAGAVAQESEGVGGIERQADANSIRWILSGPDLWYELGGRVAFPTPATVPPWADTHDLNSGVASTALATYLSDNLGVTAIVDRQIDGFTIVDTVAGMTGDWSARLQPVVDLVKRICDDAQLTCKLSVTFNGEVVVRIEPPRNLADSYMLSDQADLVSVRSRKIPARSTYVVAGGQGTGVSRVFRTANNGATGRSRRETFLDQSSLADADEVQASANTTLRLDAETWSVSAQTSDLAAEAFRFGRDVLVGDSITIEVDRRRFVVPVTAIAWHVAADRQNARATLGVASPDALRGLLRDVGNLAARFESNVA